MAIEDTSQNKPTLKLSDILDSALAYRDQAHGFAQSAGMLYNPGTNTFVANPQYLTPLQQQQLAQQQLQMKLTTDPAYAAGLANQAQEQTNMPAGQQQELTNTQNQIQALLQLQEAAQGIAGQSPLGVGLTGLLSHIPGLAATVNPAYAKFQNAVAAANASGVPVNGVITPGQAPGQAFATLLSNLHQKLQSLSQPVPYQQTNTNLGGITGPASANAYDMTAPANLNPGQMGAQAYNQNVR